MDPEERELQIKIAKLQMDIQYNLTIAITILAILFAILIGEWQILLSISNKNLAYIATAILITVAIVFSFLMAKYGNRCESCRKELKELT